MFDVRVLLVEDDRSIADSLRSGLERYGYEVTAVATGSAALSASAPDVVLLDLGLPDMDGLDVCRMLRAHSTVPIIVITARGDEIDTVAGLEVGADDYVAKPFGVREIIARIRAVMRRIDSAPDSAAAVQAIGDIQIDRSARRVLVHDKEVALTPKEFDLLAYLGLSPGAVRTREELMDAVWDEHWFGSTRTLDVHIAALRQKFADRFVITTVRGVGFRLDVPT
ncbi:response regulator transcription factor [Rhodococcus sp. WWJCD1]|uniref:response regulator transcription factor n=1 Tax=Rhodococcus sp. WWJCD1 TaxID=2022519 RepID=UPI00159566B7|nr:response regulator transcription factor [Rhodococcus sp. WWJCD1]